VHFAAIASLGVCHDPGCAPLPVMFLPYPATPLPPCLACAQVVLYTVDGASLLPVVRGTLPGAEVLTTVDFGPTTDVKAAFQLQARWADGGAGRGRGEGRVVGDAAALWC
jgi:hypothetical protein